MDKGKRVQRIAKSVNLLNYRIQLLVHPIQTSLIQHINQDLRSRLANDLVPPKSTPLFQRNKDGKGLHKIINLVSLKDGEEKKDSS